MQMLRIHGVDVNIHAYGHFMTSSCSVGMDEGWKRSRLLFDLKGWWWAKPQKSLGTRQTTILALGVTDCLN
jgi:hypothetical protein